MHPHLSDRCISNYRMTQLFQLQRLEPRTMLAVVNVSTTAELVNAVNNGLAGDTINIAAGTYTLTAPLSPKGGMIIDGAGVGQTIITGASGWNPGTTGLPDHGVTVNSNRNAFLFSFADKTRGVKITDMTLTGPQLHGALFGSDPDQLELGNIRFQDFLWSGVRTYYMDDARIHDCEFVNTGGRWDNGNPGLTGGVTGGGIYVTYMKTSEIWNNTFYRTNTGAEKNFYGIKGREARNSRIHHNTFNTNFSIEFPHEHDYYVEIDHNYIIGTVSIPKGGGGGVVPVGGYTFDIHHNYFRKSYALEFPRNGTRIHHNLFDFPTNADDGNLITNFAGSGETAGPGPTEFHNNLIKNPGRGLYNTNGAIANNFNFYNNHVIANTTVTPRTEGMFGFASGTDFTTVNIKDNVFEFNGTSRPLFKNTASRSAVVSNNTLTGVNDTAGYSNPNTGATRGPIAPLAFTLGKNDEYTVNGWNLSTTPTGIGTFTDTADIGAVAAAGSASHASGTYTVAGSGADIWNTADEFRYLYKSFTGDGEIVARVASVQNTNAWAKAGVMFRETLAANARNVAVVVSSASGANFQYRTSAGGTTASTTATGVAAPRWVKLVRSGNVFTAYHSADGAAWTQIGAAQTITMGATVYVGLAVTSHADGVVCSSSFTNVSVNATTVTAPAAPSALGAAAASSSQINLSWTDNSANETGFRIERKTGSAGTWAEIGTVGAGVTAFQNTGLTVNTQYFYRVRAYNTAGNSAYSNEAGATTVGGGILTTTGNYAYGWSAYGATAPDANATYTGDGPLVWASGTHHGINANGNGAKTFTATYQFSTPAGSTFGSASVKTNVAWYQSSTHSILGEYSVDGGSTWLSMFNFTTQSTITYNTGLTAIAGKTNVLIRYTYTAGSNAMRDHGRLFRASTAGEQGFAFTAVVN